MLFLILLLRGASFLCYSSESLLSLSFSPLHSSLAGSLFVYLLTCLLSIMLYQNGCSMRVRTSSVLTNIAIHLVETGFMPTKHVFSFPGTVATLPRFCHNQHDHVAKCQQIACGDCDIYMSLQGQIHKALPVIVLYCLLPSFQAG